MRETTKNHRVYSVGEAETMQRVLTQHSSQYSYLTTNADTSMHEQMQNYRANHI